MNKTLYWKNRKAGKRGQGDKPNLIKTIDVTTIQNKKYFETHPGGNRATRRQK